MEKKIVLTLNGKVIGATTDSSSMSTNSLDIQTVWFECKAGYSPWLDHVLMGHGTTGTDSLESLLEKVAKDWSSTWQKMLQKIATSPKLTITIGELYYSLRLEEVINGEKRMSECLVNMIPEKLYHEQWAWGVLRGLISDFYLGEINEPF